jgi:transitional endoplasmic reticulum ATPase
MGHRNYLFYGPPGTGKTLGVQYIASRLGIDIYDGKSISNPQQVAETFGQMRQITKGGENKAILMLDEVDRFSSRDDVVDPGQRQTLNQLLVEMQGMESNHGIFIFGMSNKENSIDSALRRPGRFSKEIEFMPPDKEGRLRILKIHADRKGGHMFKVDEDDLEYASTKTFGYTGADLRGLLDEAFTYSVLRDDRCTVTTADIEKAIKNTKPSALRDMPFREPQKTFADVGGYEYHVMLARRIFAKPDGSMSLFYGPPGTGKTDFAEIVAGSFGYNLIVVSGSEPEDKFVGETGKKIDRYLNRAKQLAPCVLLFDEMDALLEKKNVSSHKSSWTGLLQSRLSKPLEGVHVIGTMNRPDLLNPTFIQRFPHKLYFGMPAADELYKIWQIYLPEGMDAQALAEAHPGITGRTISETVLKLNDFGMADDPALYHRLLDQYKAFDSKPYDSMVATIGDSVRDYRMVEAYRKEMDAR